MWIEEIRQLPCGPRECRRFAFLISPILGGLGLWFAFRHHPVHPWLWIPALVLAAFGLAAPTLLRWPYRLWMSAGILMGAVVSTLLLSLLYLLVLTPLGLAARLAGKDFLQQRPGHKAPSYWKLRPSPKPRPPADYRNQF